MKAEDLRLGNLLLIDGQITEVWGLDLDGVNGLADRYDSMVTNYPKTVEPIALTEEWLRRLGAVLQTDDEDEPDNLCKTFWTLGKFHYDSESKEFIDITGYGIATCEYVHQLQNLFYALTGQELEVKTIA